MERTRREDARQIISPRREDKNLPQGGTFLKSKTPTARKQAFDCFLVTRNRTKRNKKKTRPEILGVDGINGKIKRTRSNE